MINNKIYERHEDFVINLTIDDLLYIFSEKIYFNRSSKRPFDISVYVKPVTSDVIILYDNLGDRFYKRKTRDEVSPILKDLIDEVMPKVLADGVLIGFHHPSQSSFLKRLNSMRVKYNRFDLLNSILDEKNK